MGAIRIGACAGCGALCENAKYCVCCREDAALHARRAGRFFGGLVRADGGMPAEVKRSVQRKLLRIGVNVVLLAAWLWMAADIISKGRGW